MKNTVQARKNGGTKTTDVQIKTSRRASLAENQTRPFVNSPINEARAAKAQSSCLHWLLSDVLFHQKDGVYGEETQFGITELIIATHDRMDRALASLEALANSKPEAAV